MPLLVAAADFDCVDRGVTHARMHDNTQSDNDDDAPTETIEELLGPMSQRKDTDCVNDGVDVSVDVGVGAGIRVGVGGLGVSLGVGPGVGLVVASPPSTFHDSKGARLRSGSLTT